MVAVLPIVVVFHLNLVTFGNRNDPGFTASKDGLRAFCEVPSQGRKSCSKWRVPSAARNQARRRLIVGKLVIQALRERWAWAEKITSGRCPLSSNACCSAAAKYGASVPIVGLRLAFCLAAAPPLDGVAANIEVSPSRIRRIVRTVSSTAFRCDPAVLFITATSCSCLTSHLY